MDYQNKNFKYIDAEAYDRRGESSVLENYVLGLWQPFLKNKISQISNGRTVIDWGCGTCEYVRAATSAKKIYAIDISQDMIKVCYKKLENFNNKEIICSSGFKNEIPAGVADLVLTIGVWEYVDPVLLFNELKKLTKKGGKIIVVFPNIYNDLNLMRSIVSMKTIALRPGVVKKLFTEDFKLIEKASFGNVCWFPKKLQFLILPIWKFCDFIYKPFQKFLPLGINVYYLFERK